MRHVEVHWKGSSSRVIFPPDAVQSIRESMHGNASITFRNGSSMTTAELYTQVRDMWVASSKPSLPGVDS